MFRINQIIYFKFKTMFFSKIGYGSLNLPNTEKISKQILALPMFPTLQKEEINYIIDNIININYMDIKFISFKQRKNTIFGLSINDNDLLIRLPTCKMPFGVEEYKNNYIINLWLDLNCCKSCATIIPIFFVKI